MKGHAADASAADDFAAAAADAFAADAALRCCLCLSSASASVLHRCICCFRFVRYSLSCVSYTCASCMLALFSVYPEGFILCLNGFIHLVLATCAFPQRACVRASLDTSANN